MMPSKIEAQTIAPKVKPISSRILALIGLVPSGDPVREEICVLALEVARLERALNAQEGAHDIS